MSTKFLFTIFLSVVVSMAAADNFSVTPMEQRRILEEAEDWIDDMPDGIQDRLADAVAHAQHGFYSEIDYFRNYKDTTDWSRYGVTVTDMAGGRNSNIPMRMYRSGNKANNAVFIYFHGGGWTMGNIDNAEKFCRALASFGNITVISIEYPKAPENPYPSAVNIACEAIDYIKTLFGNDGIPISIGGDGAGGNIALNAFNLLPTDVKIHSLVLIYPILNMTGTLDAGNKKDFGKGYGFDSRLWEVYVNAYKGVVVNIEKQLPPTLLISAGRDILIEDIRQFARQNGVTYVEYEGAIHGFITDGNQPTAFDKSVVLTDAFLKE